MTASEQARADAMADAETLAGYFACAGFPPSILPGKAAAILKVNRPATVHYADAPEWAARDARAAFRAVPGLR